jgi:hypothetical protein
MTGAEITAVDSFLLSFYFLYEAKGWLLKCGFEIRVEWAVVV